MTVLVGRAQVAVTTATSAKLYDYTIMDIPESSNSQRHRLVIDIIYSGMDADLPLPSRYDIANCILQ